jgi:hypothetical protein
VLLFNAISSFVGECVHIGRGGREGKRGREREMEGGREGGREIERERKREQMKVKLYNASS